jgi:hypothetical protein
MDDQPVLVDQPIADQRVYEGRSAVGDDDTTGLALELVDLLSVRPMMWVPASRSEPTFQATTSSASGGSPQSS